MQQVCQPLLKPFLVSPTRSLLGNLLAFGRHGGVTGTRLFSIAGTESLPSKTHSWSQTKSTTAAIPTRHLHTSAPCFARKARSPPKKPSPNAPPKVLIPFGSKTRAELAEIFKKEVDYNEGNEVLRILHGRRVTGALIDRGVESDEGASIPREASEHALAWLRAKHPVDEQSAAVIWADMEAKKLEAYYIARGESLGLYKPLSPDQLQEAQESSESVYGRSVLDERRKYNEDKAAQEAKRKEKSGEAQKERELALARQEDREQRSLERKQRREARMAELQKKGQASDMTEVPDMTAFQRLFLPTAFALVVVSIVFTLALSYEAPTRFERMFPEVPASVATVACIIGINVIVWMAWKLPAAWNLLNKYTVVAPGYPYAFTMLGNVFSHSQFTHLASNMMGVCLWGISLHEDIGRGEWVALFLIGGVVGSATSLWAHVLAKAFTTSSQGASGAVYAIACAWAYLTVSKGELPNADNPSPFIWDIVRWATLVFSFLPHFLPAFWLRSDGMAHLGGAAVGLLGAMYIDDKRRHTKQGSDPSKPEEPAEVKELQLATRPTVLGTPTS